MDKTDFLKLGYKIKFERSKKKLSQMDLSLKTGLTTRSLSRIECGIIDPKFSTLIKIAEALEIDLCELLNFKLWQNKKVRQNFTGLFYFKNKH